MPSIENVTLPVGSFVPEAATFRGESHVVAVGRRRPRGRYRRRSVHSRGKLHTIVRTVEAVFELPATSVAPPAGTEAMTFPAVVIPLTATLNVVGPPVTVATRVPPAVLPAKETLAAGKVPAGSLNTTVKLIGPAVAGSL